MEGRTLKETIFGRPFSPGHVSAPLGIFSRTFCTMSVSELRQDVSQAKGTGSLGSSSWQLLSDLGTRASGPTNDFSGCYFTNSKSSESDPKAEVFMFYESSQNYGR